MSRDRGASTRPRGRALDRRPLQQLDHHQCRRRSDGRQADRHPRDPYRSRPSLGVPQHSRCGHRRRPRGMECPRCDLSHAAGRTRPRVPLLRARPRRPPDRGRPDQGARRRKRYRVRLVLVQRTRGPSWPTRDRAGASLPRRDDRRAGDPADWADVGRRPHRHWGDRGDGRAPLASALPPRFGMSVKKSRLQSSAFRAKQK
jgi:hypothetical protein